MNVKLIVHITMGVPGDAAVRPGDTNRAGTVICIGKPLVEQQVPVSVSQHQD